VIGLPGGSGDVGGDDIGGVPVQGDPGPVVGHGCAGVGVGGGFLHVAERDADIEGGGDEGVAEGALADLLVQNGAAGDPADDPPGPMPVEPLPGRGGEDGSFAAFANGQVDRA
jgi:hypothetical protein